MKTEYCNSSSKLHDVSQNFTDSSRICFIFMPDIHIPRGTSRRPRGRRAGRRRPCRRPRDGRQLGGSQPGGSKVHSFALLFLELCKRVHCVDLGESFQTHIYLQNFVSIQPRTSPVKFAASAIAMLPPCEQPSQHPYPWA